MVLKRIFLSAAWGRLDEFIRSFSVCLLFLGIFLNLIRGLLVLLPDLVELLHVIEKLGATFKRDE